ncbi:response regulator transcription factor [bacterium]|nr:response regulator transcription factor [bacterium]
MTSQSPLNGAARRPFTPEQKPVTVLVVDPHACVREGVRALLGAYPELRVVGEASDGPTALALAAELDPDVVVLEVELPELDGAQVTARLREARPGRWVVVLTGSGQPGAVRLLLGMGARGYVLKRSPADGLASAVLAVAGGGTYLDPAVAGFVVSAVTGKEAVPAAELSAREVQVLRLIALGYSNKEVGAKLTLSVKTVETHKARSMAKLGIRTRVGIVRYAVECGWLGDDLPDPLVVEGTRA